jgi:hypothetical protein
MQLVLIAFWVGDEVLQLSTLPPRRSSSCELALRDLPNGFHMTDMTSGTARAPLSRDPSVSALVWRSMHITD